MSGGALAEPRHDLVALARRAPVALVGLGVTLQAAGSVLVAVSRIGGLSLSFWRFWVSLPLLVAMTWREGGFRAVVDRRGLLLAAAAGGAFAIHQVCFLVAIKRTSVVDVALVQVLQPLLVGLLAAPLFGERLSGRFRLWSVVGMAGAAGVVVDGAEGPTGDPAGMALAVVGVGFFVVYFLISKRARPLIDVSLFLLVTTVVATALVTALAIGTGTAVGAVGPGDVGLALAIAVMGGVLGHYLITWPLQQLPVSLPPVIQLAFPFVAGSLAWVALGERVTPVHLVGGVLIATGVVGAVRDRPTVVTASTEGLAP